MSGYTTVPYTIAYANELVDDPIMFEWVNYEYRLTYAEPRPGDWIHGILRARTRELRDKRALRGQERMKKLNTRRQWRCMDQLRCQVCGRPAKDPETGRIPWLLTKTVFEETGPDSGRTNAPPTCWDHVFQALAECPMLQDNHTLWTVDSITSAGVLADIYKPGIIAYQPVFVQKNVFVDWEAHRLHAGALAVAQVVELHGMEPVGGPRASVRSHIPL